ncbi:MAG: hemerythrin domain-containing protein [Bacteroidota bacterium]
MKRHSSIVSLSREHHGALILARLLQKGSPPYKLLPVDLKGKAAYATEKYHAELAGHFLAEEVSLLEQVRGISETMDILIGEIYAEHKELRSLFEMIPLSTHLEEDLNSLGHALEEHIRKEERTLFPLIQESCDEDLLNHIQKLLSEK